MEKFLKKSAVRDFENSILEMKQDIGGCHCYSVISKLIIFENDPVFEFS